MKTTQTHIKDAARPHVALAALCLAPGLAPGVGLDAREGGASQDRAKAEALGTQVTATSRAKPFELRTSSGDAWRLADHEGKVVILEWIDPECPMVARQHSPAGTMELVAQQLEGAAQYAWAAVNSSHSSLPQSGADVTEAARERLNIDYPALLDPTGWVGRAYGVTRTAHVVVIDPQGSIVYSGAPDNRAGKGHLLAAARLAAGQSAVMPAYTEAYGCAVRYAKDVRVGSALPPFVLPLGPELQLDRSDLLGQSYVLEWSDPKDKAWLAAHAEGGVLADTPKRWEAAGARWLMIHSTPPVSDRDGELPYWKSTATALRAACPLADAVHDRGRRLADSLRAGEAGSELLVVDARGVLIYRGPRDERNQLGTLTLEDVFEDLFGDASRDDATAAPNASASRGN